MWRGGSSSSGARLVDSSLASWLDRPNARHNGRLVKSLTMPSCESRLGGFYRLFRAQWKAGVQRGTAPPDGFQDYFSQSDHLARNSRITWPAPGHRCSAVTEAEPVYILSQQCRPD